jgi:hypothetical protein
LAAGATRLVVYVQWVAGSATAAADAVAEAEADAEAEAEAEGEAEAVALGFVAAAGVPPPTNTAVRPPMRPRTQTTARPMPNR